MEGRRLIASTLDKHFSVQHKSIACAASTGSEQIAGHRLCLLLAWNVNAQSHGKRPPAHSRL
jgi:hypothetical protein